MVGDLIRYHANNVTILIVLQATIHVLLHGCMLNVTRIVLTCGCMLYVEEPLTG